VKFLIAGAGAIGAYIGAKMARAGEDVTLFARGAHLKAMQEHGLRIEGSDGEFQVRTKVITRLEDAESVDVIFLGVKAHGLTQLAPQIAPLIRGNTTVVSTQNGIPWWFFQCDAGEFAGLRLERVDPGGVIAASIPRERVVGSIVYFSTEIVEPGVIRHTAGNRITLGEPDGSRSERCKAIAEAVIRAGLRCPVTAHLRQEIWVKILGNAAFNPISALTRATIVQMVRDPEVSAVIRNIMAEAQAVAERLGFELPVTIDQRMAGAEKVGEHKTSMLQDLEAGRPLELEAIVGAVVELGERVGVPMPHTRSVYACAKLLEKVAAAAKSVRQSTAEEAVPALGR
jgi:2-dehydropantoate 2-reductase